MYELQNIGFIEITKLSNIWRIKANQKNWNFIKAKIVYNLNFIYQSGLVDVLNETYNNPKSIILFGSYREGEDLSNSDIDIAIESDEVEDYETTTIKKLSYFEN